jgi:hypothetical protein
MNSFYLPVFIYLICIASSAAGQSLRRQFDKTPAITLVIGDSVERFEVMPVHSRHFRPSLHNTYYWYASNQLHSSQGAYDGRLLDGSYQLSGRNRAIRIQGNFKKGKRDGRWLQWHDNGNLKTIEHWRQSRLHGIYQLFDPSGNRLASGTYKNGLRNGRWQVQETSQVVRVRYKKGVVRSQNPPSDSSGTTRIQLPQNTDPKKKPEPEPEKKKKHSPLLRRIFKHKKSSASQKSQPALP